MLGQDIINMFASLGDIGMFLAIVLIILIDGTLFPDRDPPLELVTPGDRIDYLYRLCAAWDFGILPDEEAIRGIRTPAWRQTVERCRFEPSPSYHLLREWHGLERLPFLGTVPARITGDPNLEFV